MMLVFSPTRQNPTPCPGASRFARWHHRRTVLRAVYGSLFYGTFTRRRRAPSYVVRHDGWHHRRTVLRAVYGSFYHDPFTRRRGAPSYVVCGTVLREANRYRPITRRARGSLSRRPIGHHSCSGRSMSGEGGEYRSPSRHYFKTPRSYAPAWRRRPHTWDSLLEHSNRSILQAGNNLTGFTWICLDLQSPTPHLRRSCSSFRRSATYRIPLANRSKKCDYTDQFDTSILWKNGLFSRICG